MGNGRRLIGLAEKVFGLIMFSMLWASIGLAVLQRHEWRESLAVSIWSAGVWAICVGVMSTKKPTS